MRALAAISRLSVLGLLLGLAAPVARAEEPIALPALQKPDTKVVQKLLYPKAGRNEVGASLGFIGFDAFVKAPNVQMSFDLHRSETLSFGGVVGAGYGFKTAAYRELESPVHQVAPYAFRYLGSALGGVQWAPVYGKMALSGRRVLHYDTYLAGRAGVTVERSVIPGGGTPIAPTFSAGLGMRVFLREQNALRIEIRDDLLLQRRVLTDSWDVKQNVNVMIGLTMLSGGSEG